MPEDSHLDGRIRHCRLPVFTQPTGPDAPVLKRLLLPQGELAQTYDSDDGIRYLAYLELKAGGIRGNHVHRHKQEFIYVISGKIEFFAQGPDQNSPLRLIVSAGELVSIEPNIAHALRTIEPGHAIEFSPVRYDPTDTHRHAVVS